MPSAPPRPPTEAAAIPATLITQAEGTAMVSSAERLAGWRRRERDPLRDAVREAGIRGAGTTSSWSSSSVPRAGSSPVAVAGSSCGAGSSTAAGAVSVAVPVVVSVAVSCSVPSCAAPSEFHCVAS
ncbi:hypothetical protein ACFW88_31695 [Streptomyces anandii]|uniref:Uncharacterized protein n=1 Tax=Streptomyces anandii TaxID=285454 RepID=A0ABW6HEJ9_9ACTN